MVRSVLLRESHSGHSYASGIKVQARHMNEKVERGVVLTVLVQTMTSDVDGFCGFTRLKPAAGSNRSAWRFGDRQSGVGGRIALGLLCAEPFHQLLPGRGWHIEKAKPTGALVVLPNYFCQTTNSIEVSR